MFKSLIKAVLNKIFKKDAVKICFEVEITLTPFNSRNDLVLLFFPAFKLVIQSLYR